MTKTVEKQQSNNIYRIRFADSGVGGLIFLLDGLEELTTGLAKLQSKYDIEFELSHFGDLENEERWKDNGKNKVTRQLTRSLVSYAAYKDNPDITVIACNTASVAFEKLLELEKYKKGINSRKDRQTIMPIIKESAKALYNQALENRKEGEAITIGYFATAYTMNSKIYDKTLQEIHEARFPDKNERPALQVIGHNPAEWAAKVNEGVQQDAPGVKEMVQKDVSEMLKAMEAKGGKEMKACGLFCTHYPYFNTLIDQVFKEKRQENVPLVSQGKLFAEVIIKKVEQDLKKRNIAEREEVHEITAGDIPVNSLLTCGKDQEKHAKNLKHAVMAFAPELSFERIRVDTRQPNIRRNGTWIDLARKFRERNFDPQSPSL